MRMDKKLKDKESMCTRINEAAYEISDKQGTGEWHNYLDKLGNTWSQGLKQKHNENRTQHIDVTGISTT